MSIQKNNILFISRNFPPHTGGMERLLFNTYMLLKKHYNCTLIGPVGAELHLSELDTVLSCKFNAFIFLPCALFKAFFATRETQFDLIFAGSGLHALPAWIISKLRNIPFVTYTHGLDITYNNPLYKLLFVPAIRSSNLVIANSRYTAQLAARHGVDSTKVKILHPGVYIPSTHAGYSSKILNNINVEGKRILLTVGRLVKRKGITPFIRECLPNIIKTHPDVIYLIVGEEPDSSEGKVTKNILKAIDEKLLNNHVYLLGKLSDNELTHLYLQAELFIFPVIEDPVDIEGFGMVAIEAASFGTPTIAFNTGGVSDAINNDVSGKLIQPNNYYMMNICINDYLNGQCRNITRDNCRNFAKRFSWEIYRNNIETICTKIIDNQGI